MPSDWRVRMRNLLLDAGTDGVKQTVILRDLRSLEINADLMLEQLEFWRAEGKVQRFTTASGQRGGRPMTIWRATTLLEP